MAHPCPTCQKEVAHGRPENRHAPFCSARCKTVDLGKWLTESYRVTAREVPDESLLMQAAAVDPRRWS